MLQEISEVGSVVAQHRHVHSRKDLDIESPIHVSDKVGFGVQSRLRQNMQLPIFGHVENMTVFRNRKSNIAMKKL